MIVPGGHARTHKKWISRTGPGTGPGTGPKTSPGTSPGPVLGLVLGPWFCCFRLLVSQNGPETTGPTGPGTGPGTSPGTSLGSRSRELQKTFRTGTQDTGQGPRLSLIATSLGGPTALFLGPAQRHKPARAVIDGRAVSCLTFPLILVVVEDPWISRESNTSSQTAPDWDQPG